MKGSISSRTLIRHLGAPGQEVLVVVTFNVSPILIFFFFLWLIILLMIEEISYT